MHNKKNVISQWGRKLWVSHLRKTDWSFQWNICTRKNSTGRGADALSTKRARRNIRVDKKVPLSGFYWLCEAARKLSGSELSGHLIAIVLLCAHWSTSLNLGLDCTSVPRSCGSIFRPSVAEICLITDLSSCWPDSREVVVSSDCCRWECFLVMEENNTLSHHLEHICMLFSFSWCSHMWPAELVILSLYDLTSWFQAQWSSKQLKPYTVKFDALCDCFIS